MKKAQIALFAFLGNALEFYEFTIYAIFATIFAQQFFVSGSEAVSLVMSWGGFAAAFLMRPVGALFFGTIGDKLGRKVALCASILTMALATLGIGFLPNAAQIGVAAPLLLVGLRMIQGLATGGEYNGAAIFLIEKFKYNKPGFIGSIVTSSSAMGALIGVFVGQYCLEHDIWRWSFIGGGIFGIVLFCLRTTLRDTIATEKVHEVETEPKLKKSQYVQKFISNILVGGLNGAMSYTLFGFSILYMQRYLGFSKAEAFSANLIGMCAFMFGTPVFGYLYDLMTGRLYWPVILISCAIMIFPTFYIVMSGSLILGLFMLGVITAATEGPDHAFFQEGVPERIRYRFVGVSFTVGMAIFGGTTPAILTSMIESTGWLYAPAYWIAGMCMLVLVWLKRGMIPLIISKSYVVKRRVLRSAPTKK